MLLLVASAATFDEFLGKVNAKVINPLIELAFIVAFVVFIWGVLQFILGVNDPKKRADGKQHMLWGIVGFVIMFGVYGIITLLVNTFGISGASFSQDEQRFTPPKIQELKIK